MSARNLTLAEAYYTAVGQRDLKSLEKYLLPEVHLISPIGEKKGKEEVLESTKIFMSSFEALKIRKVFSSEEQAVVIYDATFPGPIGDIRSASLMTFQDKLIKKIELFFDGSAFAHMRKGPSN